MLYASLVEIAPPDSGEEDFLILVMHFRISKIILEKRGALYLNKLEFPSA